MKQFVCGLRFKQPDPNDRTHSMTERNFYVWIPKSATQEFGIPNHRLTLRMHIRSGKFEVYRAFKRPFYTLAPDSAPRGNERSGKEKVVYKGTLGGALKFGNGEYQKYHGRRLQDEACMHKPPKLDPHCSAKNQVT
jgi:hypothetical protein